MSTPASLLDLIARGGSLVGANEAAASQANTDLTRARIPVEQAQVPLVQAQTREQQARAQQQETAARIADQTLRDQELYRQALSGIQPKTTPSQPDTGVNPQTLPGGQIATPTMFEDPVGFAMSLARKGASGKFVQDIMAQGIATKKAILAMPAEERAAEDARLVPVQRELEGVAQLPPEQQPAAYQTALQRIAQIDPHAAQSLPAEFSPASLNLAIAHAGALKQHLDLLKTQQETATSGAQQKSAEATAAKAQAETPGVTAESQIKQREAEAMQNMTPENAAAMVKGSIDPAKYPDQYARTLSDVNNALRLGLGTKGVQAAIKDGSDRISQRENTIAQAQVTSIPFREAQLQNQQFQRTQQSYQFHAAELDKLATPVTQIQERIQRLNDTLAQGTPQADALVAPELLTVMSGGQGSGLRMNEAEISRIVGGRSKWEDLKAAVNKWSLDPTKANSITPEQRQEIHNLAGTVTQRANEKLGIIMNARSALAGASGPEQHRVILADTTNKLGAAAQAQPGGGSAPIVQHSPSTGAYRYSTDGGKTWLPGQPPK